MEWLVEDMVSTEEFKKKELTNIHQREKMGMKEKKRMTVKAKSLRKWRDGTQNTV